LLVVGGFHISYGLEEMGPQPGRKFRSRQWFGANDLSSFIHRSSLRAEGLTLDYDGDVPVIGICNAWSELVSCNLHLRGLAVAVKRGVLAAGGLPLEFPTMSLAENWMKPTTMLFRNLMSMDVEETIRADPIDAVVLLAGCDKTVPAQLMGAASAGIPSIMLTGGPAQPAVFRGERLGSGSDLWRYADDFRAGRMSNSEWADLEQAAGTSPGHCVEMGTASTMASVVEAIGMSLPGSAAIPAMDARRVAMAEATGRRAVELAREGLRPAGILTAEAFDNAIVALAAIGGSTNAVLHLLALAGRVGVELTLDRFAELGRRTPLLANVRPAGAFLYEDLFRAGGVPALLAELAPMLHGDAMTVTGRSLGENIASARVLDRSVIAPLDAPLAPSGGIAVVRGSLAPTGAILKRSAASPHLLRHRGRAVVFDDMDELAARVDDPDLAVDRDSVLVLRNAGPKGGPGMPEWGMLPVPARLLREGVDDIVRLSDARMSGTGFGTVVLHVSPESAVGGPLALVQEGDPIVLDADAGVLDLDVPEAELARRRDALVPRAPHYRRGYGALYLERVMQADRGCDFDFLRSLPGEDAVSDPIGMLSGWIGGW
jgi:dihydroxy-acid dehydratase